MVDRRAGLEFLERVPVAAALVDGTGAIVAMNTRLSRLVDRTVAEGDLALDFVHPDDLDRLATVLLELIEGKQPSGVAVPARIDAQGRWLDVVCTGLDLLAEPGFEALLTLVRTAPDAGELIERIAAIPHDAEEETISPDLFGPTQSDIDAAVNAILLDMAAEEGCTYQPPARLFQDFSVRCRMQRLTAGQIDIAQFRRRFALAVAGVTEADSAPWRDILRVASVLSDDLLAPFLLIARAALAGEPCPGDDELARVYGTSSPGRIRRLLDHYERSGLIVVRTDFSGRRSVSVPELGLATEPLEA